MKKITAKTLEIIRIKGKELRTRPKTKISQGSKDILRMLNSVISQRKGNIKQLKKERKAQGLLALVNNTTRRKQSNIDQRITDAIPFTREARKGHLADIRNRLQKGELHFFRDRFGRLRIMKRRSLPKGSKQESLLPMGTRRKK